MSTNTNTPTRPLHGRAAAERLLQAIDHRSLSVADAAQSAGLPVAEVSSVLHDHPSRLTADMAQRLADALGVSLAPCPSWCTFEHTQWSDECGCLHSMPAGSVTLGNGRTVAATIDAPSAGVDPFVCVWGTEDLTELGTEDLAGLAAFLVDAAATLAIVAALGV